MKTIIGIPNGVAVLLSESVILPATVSTGAFAYTFVEVYPTIPIIQLTARATSTVPTGTVFNFGSYTLTQDTNGNYVGISGAVMQASPSLLSALGVTVLAVQSNVSMGVVVNLSVSSQ